MSKEDLISKKAEAKIASEERNDKDAGRLFQRDSFLMSLKQDFVPCHWII